MQTEKILSRAKDFMRLLVKWIRIIAQKTGALIRALHIPENLARLGAFLTSEETRVKALSILRKVIQAVVALATALLGWALVWEKKIAQWLKNSQFGKRLSETKVAAFLRKEPQGRIAKGILCIVLCVAIISGLLTMCGGGGSSSGSGGYSGGGWCSACSGSGNCRTCGGSGRVVEFTGRENMDLPCTRCGQSGNCQYCGGSGRE